ncbi:MAG TPA: hypothetical protein VMB03_03825 [Bryobacteraceae bacterium]|nr:hypothetical protein [Bryobacteraceae bacterium]
MRYLDWLLNPVTFYSGASICLLVSLWLFISVKIELARLSAEAEDREEAKEIHDPEVGELKVEIAKLREAVDRLEAERFTPPIATATDKRSQVIRMHRRGEPVSSIAAALETPPNEIALLLKLHAMSGRKAG